MAATYTHHLKQWTHTDGVQQILNQNQFAQSGSCLQLVKGSKKITLNWGRDGNPSEATRVKQLTFRLAKYTEEEAAAILNDLL